MATGQYIGVNGVARKVVSPYIGVEGVARNVKNGYVGVDGVARLFFAPESGGAVILEVEKVTSDTYANETTYTAEEFILLDIYPKTGGTVNVTYGGLTKTITDTSGAEYPNAQKVFFGTFNGVSDSEPTPTSGELVIEGDCRAFGCSSYYYSSKSLTRCGCITAVIDWGSVTTIYASAFQGCTGLTSIEISDSVTSIGSNAFYGCTGLTSIEFSSGVTKIASQTFAYCERLNISEIPEGITDIEFNAFNMEYDDDNNIVVTAMRGGTMILPSSLLSIGSEAFVSSYVDVSGASQIAGYLSEVKILATSPPTMSNHAFGYASTIRKITVPKGCGETYKAAENWSYYADVIVEEA